MCIMWYITWLIEARCSLRRLPPVCREEHFVCGFFLRITGNDLCLQMKMLLAWWRSDSLPHWGSHFLLNYKIHPQLLWWNRVNRDVSAFLLARCAAQSVDDTVTCIPVYHCITLKANNKKTNTTHIQADRLRLRLPDSRGLAHSCQYIFIYRGFPINHTFSRQA